jgi:DNA repair protein RadA/Sms
VTTKTVYVCQSCGSEQPRWFGRCPACEAWNSLVEETRKKETKRPGRTGPLGSAAPRGVTPNAPPADLGRMSGESLSRIETGLGEFDRVLGGGLVPGEVVLLGGDPGIGKSTLLLQAAAALVAGDVPMLYVSGEESERQIHLRASRLGVVPEGLFVAAETDLDTVLGHLDARKPAVAVIDSVQTLRNTELGSMPGSIGQVRECALALIDHAKKTGTAIILVGHVTKDGLVAGPRTLEHMVDAVLYFEGDRFHHYRILRAAKNRFGATHEVGVFEMKDTGLAEVPNPSEALLGDRTNAASGCAVVASLEGTRPLLVEVQALVAPKAFSYPQRVATGFEARRLTLLLAVLDQRAGIDLSTRDVFVSVAGGFRLDDPAVDLGMAVAIAGAEAQLPLDARTVYLGEIGLSGEIRRVRRTELRIAEASRLGFRLAVVPKANEAECRNVRGDDMEILPVRTLAEALESVIGPRGGRRRPASKGA